MKYKLLGLTAAILLVLTAAGLTYYRPEEEHQRIHQHLTARHDTGCDCDGSELCTHLPLVLIDTEGQTIPGEVLKDVKDRFGQEVHSMAEDGNSTINVEVRVIDNQDRNNHPSDKPAFVTRSEMRIRGNSSRNFPKLPYLLKFLDDNGIDRSIPVMGMDAHHEWVLHAPSLDKTLVRNYVTYNCAGEFMHWVPNCRYCEVILNGEYVGIYLMVESITAGENCRLNLKVTTKGAQGVGYVIRSDRPTEADLGTTRDIYSFLERSSSVYEDYSIRYPGSEKLTPELAKDIELDYSSFEKALFSYDYDDPSYGYRAWIDVDNFADYYIINEFSGNIDSGRYSTYIYKEMEEPFRLCVWDFNNAYDNYRETEIPDAGLPVRGRAWFFMLFKDDYFVQRVLERYAELRKTWLSTDYLLNYIDETIEYLGPAVARNNAHWPVGMPGEHNLTDPERNPATFEEAVTDLKTWLTARGEWLDENIHTLQQYCHPSRNKPYNH